MNKTNSFTGSFANIQAFLDDTHGQITIGETPPIRSAALAAQGKKVRVALVRRDNETVSELLLRLDAALAQALANDTAIDEVLPEIKRRRSHPTRGSHG
jgi:hypothetical protein